MATRNRTKASRTKAECKVPDCPRTPVRRGLCTGHWDTHRGLADPKATKES